VSRSSNIKDQLLPADRVKRPWALHIRLTTVNFDDPVMVLMVFVWTMPRVKRTGKAEVVSGYVMKACRGVEEYLHSFTTARYGIWWNSSPPPPLYHRKIT
jgi:hypothetical protein